jgi:hypothetical protein
MTVFTMAAMYSKQIGVSAFRPVTRSISRSCNRGSIISRDPLAMAAINDWSPARTTTFMPAVFDRMNEMMRDILRESLPGAVTSPTSAFSTGAFPIDVKEADKSYEIVADVPGEHPSIKWWIHGGKYNESLAIFWHHMMAFLL